MRWLVSLFFVLALGLMGCSETTGNGGTGGNGGVGGDGGAAGVGGGGVGGDGGSGGVGGGCIPGEFGQDCTTADFDGLCIDGVCMPDDCSELDEVACVVDISPETGVRLGFCILRECEPAVEDCSGAEDETLCDVASGAVGLCFEQVCYMNPLLCETAEPGDLCWAPPIGDGSPEPSVCVISPEDGSIVCAL